MSEGRCGCCGASSQGELGSAGDHGSSRELGICVGSWESGFAVSGSGFRVTMMPVGLGIEVIRELDLYRSEGNLW